MKQAEDVVQLMRTIDRSIATGNFEPAIESLGAESAKTYAKTYRAESFAWLSTLQISPDVIDPTSDHQERYPDICWIAISNPVERSLARARHMARLAELNESDTGPYFM